MSRPGQPVPPRPTAPSQGLGRLGAALGARLGMVWLATVLTLAGTAAQATTLTAGLMGEVWFRADPWAVEGGQSVPSGARSKERAILEAEAIMAGRPADASFVSTGLDYPQGADTVQSSNNNDAASPLQGASVQDFLGTDFASFVLREGVSAPASAPLQQSLWRFTGVLRLDPLTTYHFRLSSDDGHAIWVGAVGTYGVAGSWMVEGIGEDFIPGIADFSMVSKGCYVSDKQAFDTARSLLRREGILAGSSTGVLIHAAAQYARQQSDAKNIVTFACDSGNKYLSRFLNDYWMQDQGFLNREGKSCIADLVARKMADHAVVSVRAEDTLLKAYSLMRLYEVSQLPILEEGRVAGMIDESDILWSVSEGSEESFQAPVKDQMTGELMTLHPSAPIDEARSLFKKGMVVIVEDENGFYGLVTPVDYLNYMKLKLQN